MLLTLKQNQATAAKRRVFFWMFDAATGTIGQTGQTANITVRVCKNDATSAASAGVIAEVDATNLAGLYYYQATVAELDTEGTLILYISCSGCLTRRIHLTVTGVGPLTTVAAGTSVVTATLTDSVSSAAIADALVYIYNSAGTLLQDYSITNSSGQAFFSLEAGTYTVKTRKLGSYTFSDQTFTAASGTAVAVAYTGTPFSPTTPSSSALCTVYGWERDAQGNAQVVTVKAELSGDANFLSSDPHIISQAETVSSRSSDGYWELALTRSAQFVDSDVQYSFKIDGTSMGSFTVPNQATKSFADLYAGS